jgi:molecular chaperone DnaK
VIDHFNSMIENPHMFLDASEFAELGRLGKQALVEGDIDKLRPIMNHLDDIRLRMGGEDAILSSANIVLG